jgi:hypothetical protein
MSWIRAPIDTNHHAWAHGNICHRLVAGTRQPISDRCELVTLQPQQPYHAASGRWIILLVHALFHEFRNLNIDLFLVWTNIDASDVALPMNRGCKIVLACKNYYDS